MPGEGVVRVVEGEVRVRGTLTMPQSLYTSVFQKILVRVASKKRISENMSIK